MKNLTPEPAVGSVEGTTMARRWRTLGWVAVGLAAAGCYTERHPERYRDIQSLPVAEGTLVRVDLRSHDVHVRVAGGDTLEISSELEARAASPRAARAWIDANTPIIEASSVGVTVRLPDGGRRAGSRGLVRPRARIDLALPPGCTADISTSSGDVTVQGNETLLNPLRIRTASGNLLVRGGAGELIFRSTSGNARIEGPPLVALEAKTSSGDIRALGGAARVLIDTRSGDLRLANLTGAASLSTSSGEIRARWISLPSGERISARTASGNVELSLPEGRWRGQATTRSGALYSGIGGDPGPRRRRSLVFSAPEPGAELEVTTTSGNIRLLRTRSPAGHNSDS